jgi:hypothetical protein
MLDEPPQSGIEQPSCKFIRAIARQGCAADRALPLRRGYLAGGTHRFDCHLEFSSGTPRQWQAFTGDKRRRRRYCFLPLVRIVAIAATRTDAAPKDRHVFKYIANCGTSGFDRQMGRSYAASNIRQVTPNTDDDDTMTRLRHTMILGLHDKRARQYLAVERRFVGKWKQNVLCRATATGQIFRHEIEDLHLLDRRGKHPLDVLHYEGRRAKLAEDIDVLLIKAMPVLCMCYVSQIAWLATAAGEGICLARRPTDKDYTITALPPYLCNSLRYDLGCSVCTKGEIQGLMHCRLPLLGIKSLPIRLISATTIEEIDVLFGKRRIEFPQEGAQSQSPVCNRVLFNREIDLERAAAICLLHPAKSLSEASGP